MAQAMTIDSFKEIKESLKEFSGDVNAAANDTGWSDRTVAYAKKARSFKQYKELRAR